MPPDLPRRPHPPPSAWTRSATALASLAVAASFLAGCPRSAVRELGWGLPRDAVLRYSFQTEHRISTELGAVPADVAGDPGLPALREGLSEWTFVLGGELEQSLARIFRDGTWGQVIRVARVEGGQRGPAGLVPLEPEGLLRKSVVVRGWRSGEAFELAGFQHMSGIGRMVELWADVFTQLTIRLPRRLPAGEGAETEEPASMSLRIPLADGAHLERSWTIRWRSATTQPCDAGTCMALAYSARIAETGRSPRPDRRLDVRGAGTVEGTVVLDPASRLVSHEYRTELTRDLTTYELPRGPKEDGPARAAARVSDRATTTIRRLP